MFYDKIEELVTCAICMELPVKPVTTECGHNVCKVSQLKVCSSLFRKKANAIQLVSATNYITIVNIFLCAITELSAEVLQGGSLRLSSL